MAKTTRETKPELYIVLSADRSSGYFHLYGRVVTRRYEQGAGYQPAGADDTYGDGPLFSGLQLRCQGDEDSRRRAMAGERDAPVYGFTCEYRDMYHVDRRMAVRMAKTLTQLEAKLAKLSETRGYVHTYGEYVGRVAEALGCTGIAWARTERNREMTGERWQWNSLGDGVSYVNRQIDAWVDEAKPAPASSEAVAS